MAFRWRADDGPLFELFGSSLISSKNVRVGPPLAKLSSSAYVCIGSVLQCGSRCPFLFSNHLAEEERAGCVVLIVM